MSSIRRKAIIVPSTHPTTPRIRPDEICDSPREESNLFGTDAASTERGASTAKRTVMPTAIPFWRRKLRERSRKMIPRQFSNLTNRRDPNHRLVITPTTPNASVSWLSLLHSTLSDVPPARARAAPVIAPGKNEARLLTNWPSKFLAEHALAEC